MDAYDFSLRFLISINFLLFSVLTLKDLSSSNLVVAAFTEFRTGN